MEKVFRLLNQMVRDGEIQNYAIGGAIAAVFYVEPRQGLEEKWEGRRRKNLTQALRVANA